MSDNENTPIIEVKNLKQYFNINVGLFRSKPLKAVDDVSFSIKKGETLQAIARKCHTTVDALCKLNRIGRNIRLMPGQILKYN